jgi:molybdopterin/thiamine biosynthesis adenylyltransferase
MGKILVVGAGGIGSWLAKFIYDLAKFKQFPNHDVVFADDDQVDTKNISYQNFEPFDIFENKAVVLADKYNFVAIQKKIVDYEDLLAYNCIISAVDNSSFRRLLFKTAEQHPNKYWIDLRSEGRAVAFFTKHEKTPLDFMLNTLPKENEEKEDGSCQNPWELEQNIIQFGNRIIASIGTQLLLNYSRGETNPPSWSFNF